MEFKIGGDILKKIIALICLLLLIGGMYLTNPGMDKYTKWYEKDIVSKNPESIIATIGDEVRASAIKSSTYVKDYKFFSYYVTVIGSQSILVIGLLNNFISTPTEALLVSLILSSIFTILLMVIVYTD